MMALAAHEIRIAARRAAWPVALTLHALSASLFVMVWGPTGGIPLWQATVLQQLALVERLAIAALLTWLATYVFAEDSDEADTGSSRAIADWSALLGLPGANVFQSRAIAAAGFALIFVAVAVPALVAAGALSAATGRDVAAHSAALFGFAWFAVSVTGATSVVVRSRIRIWCCAMALSAIAAVALRLIDTTLARAVVPALVGMALVTAARSRVRGRTR